MKRFTIVTLILAFSVAALASTESVDRPNLSDLIGKNFEVTTIEGKTVSLSSLVGDGRPVVIEFWATWCAPCRKTLPHLIELQKKHGKDLVIVGLTVEDPGKDTEKVKKYVGEQGVNFPIAFAPDELFQYMNSRRDIAVPKFFLFDAKGQLVSYIPRYSPFTPRNVRSAVNKTLSRK